MQRGPLSARGPQDSDDDFAVLMAEFRPALMRYFARRLISQNEIEDLVHDVFVRLVRNRKFADAEARKGYVFQTANSVLVDYIRRQAVSQARVQANVDPDTCEGVDLGPDRVLQGRQELARAVALLLELPERTRTVFILRRIEGMRFADIAARLGVSVSATEKHMQRAILHLMENLGDDSR